MIEESGECEFSGADDANIPVDIWLMPYFEEDEATGEVVPTGKWTLTAANYMPRKCCVHSEAYCAVSDSRDELADVVRAKIIPLYQAALAKLEDMCEPTDGKRSLYYWKKP